MPYEWMWSTGTVPSTSHETTQTWVVSYTHLPFHSSSIKSLQYPLNRLDRTFYHLVLKNFTYSNTMGLTVDLAQSKTFRIVDYKFLQILYSQQPNFNSEERTSVLENRTLNWLDHRNVCCCNNATYKTWVCATAPLSKRQSCMNNTKKI
jgi:hypothetical protein